ncbi:hypothetical protein [Streptomyces sp. NPDC001880]
MEVLDVLTDMAKTGRLGPVFSGADWNDVTAALGGPPRVQQLTREHCTLQERLEGARSSLRFADERIADLETQLLEQDHS